MMSSIDGSDINDISVNNREEVEDKEEDNKSVDNQSSFRKLTRVQENTFSLSSPIRGGREEIISTVTFGNQDMTSPKNYNTSSILSSINQDLDALSKRLDDTLIGNRFCNASNNYGCSIYYNPNNDNGIVNKDVIKSMSLENNNSMNEIEQLRISNQKSIDELNMLLNKGLNDEQSNDVNNTTYVSQSSRERKANAKVLYNDSNLSQTNLF